VSPILLIGAGRMGGALLTGWAKRNLSPLIVVEPSPSTELKSFARRNRIALFALVDSIASLRARACIVALKPQVLKAEATRLRPIAQSGTLMISIAAGTNTAMLKKAWGARARIIRAMPNTPGAIGRGIAALYAANGTRAKDKALAEQLLAALGETVWVKKESQIDAVTAVSASGPPARLRQNVTSPGGTTEAALKILMAKSGLSKLLRRAVAAAHARARELGS
jgi:pyrroline-5-carboxylate reductase